MRVAIEGMHCDACVRRVRKAIEKVAGAHVEDVQIGSAVISIDPRARARDSRSRAKSGVPAASVQMTETIHIHVGGMTCAACQSHVQRALEQTPGVRNRGCEPDDGRCDGRLRSECSRRGRAGGGHRRHRLRGAASRSRAQCIRGTGRTRARAGAKKRANSRSRLLSVWRWA